MISKRFIWLSFIAIFALIVGISYKSMVSTANSNGDVVQQKSSGNAAIGGPFTLVDQHGNTRTEKDFAGNYTIVFFGFTHCPDVCPTGLFTISEAMKLLSDEQRSQVAPLFITVDAQNDTPEKINDYLSNFHESIVGLTGTQEQLKQVQDAYKVYAQKVEMPGSDMVMFDHSAYIYIMNPQGEYLQHKNYKATPQEIVDVLLAYVK